MPTTWLVPEIYEWLEQKLLLSKIVVVKTKAKNPKKF